MRCSAFGRRKHFDSLSAASHLVPALAQPRQWLRAQTPLRCVERHAARPALAIAKLRIILSAFKASVLARTSCLMSLATLSCPEHAFHELALHVLSEVAAWYCFRISLQSRSWNDEQRLLQVSSFARPSPTSRGSSSSLDLVPYTSRFGMSSLLGVAASRLQSMQLVRHIWRHIVIVVDGLVGVLRWARARSCLSRPMVVLTRSWDWEGRRRACRRPPLSFWWCGTFARHVRRRTSALLSSLSCPARPAQANSLRTSLVPGTTSPEQASPPL